MADRKLGQIQKPSNTRYFMYVSSTLGSVGLFAHGPTGVGVRIVYAGQGERRRAIAL